MECILVYVSLLSLSRPGLTLPFSKEVLFFINSSRARRSLIFEIQFLMLFYVYSKTTRNGKFSLKIKIDNPKFVDEEDIPLINQDEDYNDYKTPDTSRVEALFIEPDTTEATSFLRLRQKVKRDKHTALYRHLNVTGNIDLIDFDQFRLTKDPKNGVTIFEFYNGDSWVPLTKQTGKFLYQRH